MGGIMTSFLDILLLSLLLGIKHSIEPDHVIAVSSLVTESKKISGAMKLGFFWGLGHTVVLFIIGSSFILLKSTLPESISTILESLVGIMLIYFGVKALINRKHEHTHFDAHSGYIKSVIMGVIHGLSGSGALIVLTMSTVATFFEAVNFILIFGFGTIMGMMASTTLISIPFVSSNNTKNLNQSMTIIVSAISIFYGIYYTISHIAAMI
jgi:sulfite exporter TauE/SafE